jgi:hypothetical protein
MRKIIVLAAALAIGFAGVALGQSRNPLSSVQMLAAATTTATGEAMSLRCDNRTFQAMGTTTAGSGSAVIVIEASNKTTPVTGTNVDWTTLGTITLTLGTTQTNDGFVSYAAVAMDASARKLDLRHERDRQRIRGMLNMRKLLHLALAVVLGAALGTGIEQAYSTVVRRSAANPLNSIVGGSIDNTPIGATTPSTGAFTTLTTTGNVTSALSERRVSDHGRTATGGGSNVGRGFPRDRDDSRRRTNSGSARYGSTRTDSFIALNNTFSGTSNAYGILGVHITVPANDTDAGSGTHPDLRLTLIPRHRTGSDLQH